MKKNLLRFSQLLLYSILITAFATVPAIGQTTPFSEKGAGSAHNAGSSGVSWSNTSDATSNNNSYAEVTLNNGEVSDMLEFTDFGFDVPSNATIKGLQVIVHLLASDEDLIVDNSVRLLQNGSPAGDDRARPNTATWPTNESQVAYGNSSYLWDNSSVSWVPADINSSDFGVAIAAENFGASTATAFIDFVEIRVFFDAVHYYYDGLGDVNDVSFWWTNPNGTGNNPQNFQQDGQIFHLEGETATLSTNESWGIGGNGSKLIIGDGTNYSELHIETGADFSASIEVLDNGVYESASSEATVPTITNMAPGSKAIFSSLDTQEVLDAQYYDLQVSGGHKILVDDTRVDNEFVFDNNNGILTVELGPFDLIFDENATLTNAGASSYFVTNGDGFLEQYVADNQTVVFPVGTFDNYNPVTISVEQGSNGDYFQVLTYNNIYDDYLGESPDGSQLGDHEVNQTWIINEAVVAEQTIADITLQWNQDEEGSNFDRNNAAIGYYNGTNWVGSATSQANGSDPYTLTLEDAFFFNTTPYGVGDEQSPVPVELISFTAKLQPEGGVMLEWATASELNNSHFEIQFTLDGHHWEHIGEVAGHGTTAQMHEYSYFDARQIAQNTCYRLKQVDFNGEFEYSNVECVEANGAGDVAIYPNPANVNQTINIDLGTENTVNATVRIVNMQGQVVKHLQLNEAYNAQIQVSDLASGWYTIQVNTPGNSFAERILLTK